MDMSPDVDNTRAAGVGKYCRWVPFVERICYAGNQVHDGWAFGAKELQAWKDNGFWLLHVWTPGGRDLWARLDQPWVSVEAGSYEDPMMSPRKWIMDVDEILGPVNFCPDHPTPYNPAKHSI